MKRILEFFKANKYAVIWTACYIAVMWAILAGLFSFDMFSGADWSKLMRAQLRGFPGFVFGILILSALPLYVATTVLVVRNKAPLVTVPVPDTVKAAAKKLIPKKKEPAADAATEEEKAEEAPAESEKSGFPDDMPSELRGAFVRARQHISRTPTSNFDTSKMVNSATAAAQMPELMPVGGAANGASATTPAVPGVQQLADEVPLPSDFDVDDDMDDFGGFGMSAPMFKDIDFGGGEEDSIDMTPVLVDGAPVAVDNVGAGNSVQDFLAARGIESNVGEDGLVRAPGVAIATHDDAAFWIADADAWFATGNQKPSPIMALQAAAADGLMPVLYLAEKNIMDIDALRAQWTADGIVVIDSLDALPL